MRSGFGFGLWLGIGIGLVGLGLVSGSGLGLGVVERVTFPYDDLVVGEDLEGEQRCEAQPGQG